MMADFRQNSRISLAGKRPLACDHAQHHKIEGISFVLEFLHHALDRSPRPVAVCYLLPRSAGRCPPEYHLFAWGEAAESGGALASLIMRSPLIQAAPQRRRVDSQVGRHDGHQASFDVLFGRVAPVTQALHP